MPDFKRMNFGGLCSFESGPSWSPLSKYVTSTDASSGVDITDPSIPSKRIVVDDLIISSAAAVEFTLKNKRSASVIASFLMAVNTTLILKPRNKFRAIDLDDTLQLVASGAGNVRVYCSWHYED